jgi:hypothetical protein
MVENPVTESGRQRTGTSRMRWDSQGDCPIRDMSRGIGL